MEPFEVFEPRAGESPLVVEVPHAGLWLDGESLARTIVPARCIGRDADLHVDALDALADERHASAASFSPSGTARRSPPSRR